MKIRDIITEAEEADLDRKLKYFFKQREHKKKRSELAKTDTVKGAIERGNRLYDKVKRFATAKIPFA
jgi:hypothetical protein